MGLNINEVVDKTKISRVSIWRLEKGLSENPLAKTIKTLADLYGKDTDYFYKEAQKDEFKWYFGRNYWWTRKRIKKLNRWGIGQSTK